MKPPTPACPPHFRGKEKRTRSLFVSVFSVVVLSAALVSGCARAHAKTVPEAPALDVPAPPARIVEANDIDALPPVPAPAQTPAPPEPARRPPPPRPRPAPRPERSSEPRADAPAVEAKPGDTPATNLQTTPTGAEGDVERAIHATLARASSDLSRVDYRGLNRDAKTQYDTAKRFVEQAEEAVRTKNLVFARNLADKAAALAAQLAGR